MRRAFLPLLPEGSRYLMPFLNSVVSLYSLGGFLSLFFRTLPRTLWLDRMIEREVTPSLGLAIRGGSELTTSATSSSRDWSPEA